MADTATPAPAEPVAQPAPAATATAPAAPTKARRSNLPDPDDNTPLRTKEQFYHRLPSILNKKVQSYFAPVAERIKSETGKEYKLRQVFGDQDGHDIFVMVWDAIFDILLSPNEQGEFAPVNLGIPEGYGSMQLTTAGATKKRTPQGAMVDVAKRWRIKYSPGKNVDSRLKQLPPPPADAPEDAGDDEEVATNTPETTATAPAAGS